MKSSSLKFLNLLWIFTIFYYCFGRVNWEIPNYLVLIIYVFICYTCINIGYKFNKWNVRMKNALKKDVSSTKQIEFNDIKFLFICSCIFLIVFQIAWVYTYFGSINFSNIFKVLGNNYFSRLDTELSGNSFVMQIKTFFWIFSYFVYPLGFIFFNKMEFRCKLLFIITIIVDIFASLNMGISKNIGDIVIVFIGILLLNPQIESTNESIKLAVKRNKKKIFFVILIAILFLVIFGVIQTQRHMALGRKEISMKVDARFGSLRKITLFDVLLGDNKTVINVVDQFGRYLSHGYTGLAYALTLNFKNTWGLGFSRALMEYAQQYLGISVSQLTYCARIEDVYGWSNGVNWPTAFVWIGNAVSLWLVPLVMVWLGRLWCKAEYMWRVKQRVMGLIVYSQLFIAFVYMSCNAQIVQSRQAFIATIMMMILFEGYRFRIRTKKIIPTWL